MKAIEISGLSKKYKGKRGARVPALKELSLDIEMGEVFGFLGPNGAGKSTTIKILMGLISADSGEARIMGKSTGSAACRRSVGYLPENPAFYDFLSAEEYLRFVGRTFGMDRPVLEQALEKVLRLMDLWEARKRLVRGYSKGMVQRLGLAQVLIHDPEIYLLDEPMSGLDPTGRALVKDIILDLKKRGKCVFFSTHITSDVETVCDRVGILVQGSLQSVERVESIMTQGVVGYHVYLKRQSDLENDVVYLEKERLPQFLEEARAAGREVVLIEPNRKNLESFFLDIVKGR